MAVVLGQLSLVNNISQPVCHCVVAKLFFMELCRSHSKDRVIAQILFFRSSGDLTEFSSVFHLSILRKLFCRNEENQMRVQLLKYVK